MMSSGGPGRKLATPRQRTARPSSGSSTGRSRTGLPHLQSGRMSMSHANMNFAPHHAKSFSAPVPMTFAPANSTGQPGSVEDEENSSRRPTPPRSARPGSTDAEPIQPGKGANYIIYTEFALRAAHTQLSVYIWPKTKYNWSAGGSLFISMYACVHFDYFLKIAICCTNQCAFSEGLSPEAQQSIDAAKDAMAKSKSIRKEIAEAVDHTHRMQVAAHSAVNEGLTRKLAQTVTLSVSHWNYCSCTRPRTQNYCSVTNNGALYTSR